MDLKLLLPALVGGIIVAVGWVVSHFSNQRRDVVAEKWKLRITFLIEAYRRLEAAASRPIQAGSDHASNLESALADIQLLGTPAQVDLAGKCSDDARSKGSIELKPLLLNLRGSLRHELGLEQVNNSLVFFRASAADIPD
jgi:hypothetical protein